MDIADLTEHATQLLPPPTSAECQIVRPASGLTVLRYNRTTTFESFIYEPVICLILRGRKETTLGETTYGLGTGECLLITHDLAVRSRITKAPYTALLFDVKLDVLRELYDEVADTLPVASPARALEVHAADKGLVDAIARYVSLANGPAANAKVLAPLFAKEIHYRLLMAPFGGMLRDLIRHDSGASAIARAIAQIRRDFRSAIEIPELARSVGMSASTFHKHFKAVTSSSPLQYQKDLRLLEARRLLRSGDATVSTAAFDVGYESPTQFSREYSRKFGQSPNRDRAETVRAAR